MCPGSISREFSRERIMKKELNSGQQEAKSFQNILLWHWISTA
jgi:hypothetical protein